METWDNQIQAALNARRQTHSFRSRLEARILDSTHLEIAGQRLINFASNNYLGLTHHPRIIGALAKNAHDSGAGSGAAALVSGYTTAHASAERAIAKWKQTESAVITGSGYTANLAAIQTIAAIAGESGVRFLLDKLSHASLLDAVRATGTPFRIFPHNGLDKLQRLLENGDEHQRQVVITESIFSMDGDAADLQGLANLKKKYPFILLLDEAHASGVYGPSGRGYAAEVGLASLVDISIITLSKAVGVYGGAICASQSFCDAVVNFGRSYIYSTNVPPAVAAAVETAIDIVQAEPDRQRGVRENARSVRLQLNELGLELKGTDSPIIPIILGDEEKTLAAAASLRSHGMFVVGIRPPTVARGSSRLRITLSSDHTSEELDQLCQYFRSSFFR